MGVEFKSVLVFFLLQSLILHFEDVLVEPFQGGFLSDEAELSEQNCFEVVLLAQKYLLRSLTVRGQGSHVIVNLLDPLDHLLQHLLVVPCFFVLGHLLLHLHDDLRVQHIVPSSSLLEALNQGVVHQFFDCVSPADPCVWEEFAHHF